MRKKVGIDLTYIREDEVSGIRKYGEEILDGFDTISNDYEFVLFVDSKLKDIYEKKYPKFRKVPIKVGFKNIKYVRGLYNRFFDKYYKTNILKKENCDIVFYPYINSISPISKKINSLEAILDIIPLDIIKNCESFKYKKVKRRYVSLMNKSKNIVTLSEYSKKRLLDINPNYDGNVSVVPSSVAKLEKSEKSIKDVLGNEQKYIFTINSFCKHKNQITLVKAFNLIKDKIPHNLVMVGRPELGSPISGYNDVVNYIKRNKLEDRVKIMSFISDEDRNALFYDADLFVSTSMQEGFGRTPVEAAMCRIPVISTVETSLPEATMGKVFYYDNATDEKELAEKIEYVLENKPNAEELEEIATLFENEYSVEKISKMYLNLIDKILKEKDNAKD